MASVKMFCVLPKRRDISDQEFHDHWRHPHGTLGTQISTVRRYVQSHRIADERVDFDESRRYEGIVEVWFDSAADARGMPDHPTYQRHLIPDEPNFIDMDGIEFVYTDEHVVRTAPDPREGTEEATLLWDERRRPTTIKLIQVFRDSAPRPDSTGEAQLARRVGALRHTICTPNAAVHSVDRPSIAAVRELWWPTVTEFHRGITGDDDAWDLILNSPATTALYQAERLL
ncbi:EthD domain-containing protein [Rhodococcus sp. JVH1]|uniref:EthD domain-containing protein n=1 Tax=Rhodococcus sp. JVH1 TaxID=745408 RepID=UPI000272134B|nr:EthD domain-containing protein [Rhodococcus sp. JVH1]EJI95745.1 hypothetical protein JVH1_6766 [Rhodococcus sp. JVH1]